jgi:hypothetical protein
MRNAIIVSSVLASLSLVACGGDVETAKSPADTEAHEHAEHAADKAEDKAERAEDKAEHAADKAEDAKKEHD